MLSTNKNYYDQLLIVGAQFRINKTVMITRSQDTKNLFGASFPPCEIKFVDKDTVIVGRSDWDFSICVDRKQAIEKFSKKSWIPVKTLIGKQPGISFCKIHQTLLPKSFVCCER